MSVTIHVDDFQNWSVIYMQIKRQTIENYKYAKTMMTSDRCYGNTDVNQIYVLESSFPLKYMREAA